MKLEFDEIYKRFFKDVYLFVLSMSKDPHTAEETTQDTFFKALKEIKHFQGNCSVKSWLPDDSDIESMCIRKDEALSIYKILHCLEEPYKEVFILRVLGDLSFREIGEIFGKQETWARVTYHRARLKIKEVMI